MMDRVIVVVLLLFTVASAHLVDRQPVKRSYVCPPNFIRLSHRCYFFSKEKATWQDAYFQCHSMHSNLAIIKNSNQDKLIRKTLSRKTLEPLERWLGGRFDWKRNQWKWAASGKPLSYKGFDKSVNQDEENLKWNCIVIDPELEYRWNSRSCLEEKHFICHKRIRTITDNKSRKKLMQQYNTNKLNEIPVPDLPNEISRHPEDVGQPKVDSQKSDPFHIEIYPLDAHAAYKKREKKWRKTRKPKEKPSRPTPALRQFANGTVYENNGSTVIRNDQFPRRRRNRVKEDENGQNHVQMYYNTYKENGQRKHPLHPSPIVVEYDFNNPA